MTLKERRGDSRLLGFKNPKLMKKKNDERAHPRKNSYSNRKFQIGAMFSEVSI